VQFTPFGIKQMIGKEKSHAGAPNWTAKPFSRAINLEICKAQGSVFAVGR
jgi:hypothetical protein